jgi:membrane protease YdiL (CAAX protease family)
MSMLNTTYPLAGMKSEMPMATVAANRPWGFWATLGWFGAALVAFFAAAIGAGFVYGLTWALKNPGGAFDANSPIFGHTITIVSMSAAAAMLAFAARRSGSSMRDYLGLTLPKLRHVAIALAALVGFALFLTGMGYLFPSMDQSEVMNGDYKNALTSPLALVLYWVVLVVSAPITEEIIFRGFLFRGWSESKLGALGALVLTSLIFGAVHLQYTWQGILSVVGLGLIFGIARWRTGSTVLSIAMHAVWNLSVGAAVALSL